MGLLDLLSAPWTTIFADGSAFSATNLQEKMDELTTLLNGNVDTENITIGSLRRDDGDGNFATVDAPSYDATAQSWTVDNVFLGTTSIGEALIRAKTETVVSSSIYHNVAGINRLVLKNTTTNNYDVKGFTGGVEDQIIQVELVCTNTGDLVMHDVYSGAADPTAGDCVLEGGTEYTHLGSATRNTGRTSIFTFVYTDCFGYYGNLVWQEISRREQ